MQNSDARNPCAYYSWLVSNPVCTHSLKPTGTCQVVVYVVVVVLVLTIRHSPNPSWNASEGSQRGSFYPWSKTHSLSPAFTSHLLSLCVVVRARDPTAFAAYFASWIFKLDIKGAKSPQDRFHEGPCTIHTDDGLSRQPHHPPCSLLSASTR